MLLSIITVLLVGVMLSITISLVVNVMRVQKRRERMAVRQTTGLSLNAVVAPVTAPLAETGTAQVEQTLSVHWYRRHRIIVSGALILMLMLALFVQTGLADGAFKSIRQGIGTLSLSGNPQGFAISTELPPMPFSATQHVVRYDSAARNQYYTDYEWQVWSYSSCSGFAMAMVINAYGHNYIAADFLEKEYALGVWNATDGLTGGEAGIALTASYFGFKALPNPPRTLQALIYTVNKDFPVIVGSPTHIMVAYGADNTYIYVADSSPVDRTAMTYAEFMNWWDGFSVVLVPR
jgi:hypothetical protein